MRRLVDGTKVSSLRGGTVTHRLALVPLVLVLLGSTTGVAVAKRVPSCTRGGARIVAVADVDVPVQSIQIVSLKLRPRGSETRHVRILGCRVFTGRRFTLFDARDFDADLIERDTFAVVGSRYIGAIRYFEGGTTASRSATTWDAASRVKLHDTAPCDVERGEFSGIDDAVFLPGGGIAYSCDQLRVVDAAGDRQLEPPGSGAGALAVSYTAGRLFWSTAAGPKSTSVAVPAGAARFGRH